MKRTGSSESRPGGVSWHEVFTQRSALLLFVVMVLTLCACSATHYVATPTDHLILNAAARLNPDLNERPSPVSVKILELADRVLFDNLDFESAWVKPEELLNDQMLSKVELVLLPGQTISHRLELKRRTEYVAIVAGFRDIQSAHWKVVYPVRSNWFSTHRLQLSSYSIELESGKGRAGTQNEQP